MAKKSADEFLEEMDEREQKIYCGILEEKRRVVSEDKKTVKSIAELVSQVLNSEVVELEDGSGLTLQEMYVPSIIVNAIDGGTVKDLLDIQKLTGVEESKDNGVQIVINTNGQDLGC